MRRPISGVNDTIARDWMKYSKVYVPSLWPNPKKIFPIEWNSNDRMALQMLIALLLWTLCNESLLCSLGSLCFYFRNESKLLI